MGERGERLRLVDPQAKASSKCQGAQKYAAEMCKTWKCAEIILARQPQKETATGGDERDS